MVGVGLGGMGVAVKNRVLVAIGVLMAGGTVADGFSVGDTVCVAEGTGAVAEGLVSCPPGMGKIEHARVARRRMIMVNFTRFRMPAPRVSC